VGMQLCPLTFSFFSFLFTVLPDCNLKGLPDSCYVAKEGSTVRLNIPIIGIPAPAVTWKKGDVTLSDSGRISVESTATNTVLLIRDCQRVDADKFTIILRNIAGTKESTIDIKVVGKPGICTGPIKFDEITAEAITVEWGPPTEDGGSEVSNYILEKRHSTANKWVTVASAIQKNSMRVTRLHDGTEYIFKVCAENKYGVGEYLKSDPVIAKHPFSKYLTGKPKYVLFNVMCWIFKNICLRIHTFPYTRCTRGFSTT